MAKSIHWAQVPGARDYQEDYAVITGGDTQEDSCMLLVCDGMGGHAAGDVASKTAARSFQAVSRDCAQSEPIDWLPKALEAANSAIADAVANNLSLKDMGTTLLACVVSGETVSWISVGDSLMYHIRRSELTQLNDDHSMAPFLDQLARDGQISEKEATSDPRRNALRSAVMGDDIPLVDLQTREGALKPGDVLLLASDGLLTLTAQEIARIASQKRAAGAKAIADALLKKVVDKDQPHQDNATVAVYIHKQEKGGGFLRSLFGR